MNMIDWLKATGEWMFFDRPDLYDSPAHAMMDLERWVEDLRKNGPGSLDTAGFSLVFESEDEVESWTLHKKISTFEVFYEEGASNAYSWTGGSGTMTRQPNLPDIDSMGFDFGLDNDD